MARVLLTTVFLLGMGCTGAFANPQKPVIGAVELEGDRPDFTESPLVVPPGVFQMEGGLTFERTRPSSNAFQALELSLRLGAWERFEWRMTLPSYVRLLSGDERLSGMGDPLVGFKYQIGPLKSGTDVAVIVHSSVPTGATDITSRHFDPEIKIPFSHPLGGPWALNGQFSAFFPSLEDGREFTYQQTLSIARDLTPKAAMFVEYIGDFSRVAADTHQLHPGFTYKVAQNLQLDIHGGIGLSEAAPDYFIGTGFVWRP